jgi:hypothetical protein
MDPPPAEGLARAIELLYALGALSATGQLTKTGGRMAHFPLDPMLAAALLAAEGLGVTGDMATVAAMLSLTGAVFYRPREARLHAEAARAAFDQAAWVDSGVGVVLPSSSGAALGFRWLAAGLFLFCFVLFCCVLFCFVLFCFVLFWMLPVVCEIRFFGCRFFCFFFFTLTNDFTARMCVFSMQRPRRRPLYAARGVHAVGGQRL